MLDVNVGLVYCNETKGTLPGTCDEDVQGVAMMDKKLQQQENEEC
jgi:hypothetical protein